MKWPFGGCALTTKIKPLTKLPPKVEKQLNSIARNVRRLMDLADAGPLPAEHAWGVIFTPLFLQAKKTGLNLKTVRSLVTDIERQERWAARTMRKLARS